MEEEKPIRVRIHWNTRGRVWSRLERRRPERGRFGSPGSWPWRVVGHNAVFCLRAARVVVSPSGHARSQRLGHRTVHAWVEGESVRRGPGVVPWTAIRYDRALGAFVEVGDPTRALEAAEWVVPERDARLQVAGDLVWRSLNDPPSTGS